MVNETGELIAIRILANRKISSSSGILSFKREYSFKAGQVIGITTDPELVPRLYSISSSELNENMELLYKVVQGGELTPKLNLLNPGDQLYITPPFGTFHGGSFPSCFIATGTGLAPFLSMIRSGKINCKLLLHGSRSIEDFYEAEYLEAKLDEKYIKCYTGEEEFGDFRGRVTSYIREISELDPNYKYYLCGSAEMVVESREALISKGIPFQNIRSEIYF